MPLTKPVPNGWEQTLEQKIAYKTLGYLLQNDDDGERHEVASLWRSLRGELFAHGVKFTVTKLGNFSRSQIPAATITQNIGDLKPEWFKSRRSRDELAPLTFDSKLTYATREIDIWARASNGTRAFFECKSGSAHSTGTQTRGYMQAATEIVFANPYHVWFVHYRDCASHASPDYLYACLEAIDGNPKTHLPPPATTFLNNVRGLLTGKRDIRALLNWVSSNCPALAGQMDGSNDTELVNSMNRILRHFFRVEVHESGYITKPDRSTVAGWLKKLLPACGEEFFSKNVTDRKIWPMIHRNVAMMEKGG